MRPSEHNDLHMICCDDVVQPMVAIRPSKGGVTAQWVCMQCGSTAECFVGGIHSLGAYITNRKTGE